MELLELLKYTLPSIIVFLTAFLIMRSFLEREERNRRLDLNLNNQKLITPIKLQAYERIILFLERISPENLIVRVQEPGMSARELQNLLITSIRTEYEHNLSQQVYTSVTAWNAVKTAKESMMKLVNSAAARLENNAKSLDLSRVILEMYMSVEESPTETAIAMVKDEVQNTFK